MAKRSEKPELVRIAERLANLSAIDFAAPGGAAYLAFMVRGEIAALHHFANVLDPVQKDGGK